MSTTAGEVVMGSLRDHIAAFHQRAGQVSAHEAEGVHKMRVASRQLRSQLGTFHGLFDRAVTDPLRDELKWFAGLLGVARDAEVIRVRLAAAVDDEEPELILGNAAQRIAQDLALASDEAHQRIDAVMTEQRFRDLGAALDRLDANPPLTADADTSADEALRVPLRRRYRQLRQAVAVVDSTDDPDEADLARHEVRKAAKRLRYAAESVDEVFGNPATETAALAEAIQGGLGEQQDSIHCRHFLLRASSAAAADGANSFTFGLLFAREGPKAQAGVDAADQAWTKLREKSQRAWLR